MPAETDLTRTAVQAAHEVIKPLIHETPVFTSSSLSASLPGRNKLYFKAENLQKGGAFKFRGASYSLSCLTQDQLAKGVCTHSSGRVVRGHTAMHHLVKSDIRHYLSQGIMLVHWH
jgi:threonine dehydratase